MGPRVVSLVPSVTETLLSWNIEPVACTRFCEQPALRHVGGTKDPDVAAIVELAPDLVVVDEEENRKEDADALAAAGLAVHITAVRSVADVTPTLERLAAATASTPNFVALPVPETASATKLAWVPIWRRPWMTINADTYGSSLLASIGIGNVFADDANRYPECTLDEAAARRPDMVIAPSEPYPFAERHVAELGTVAADVRLVDGRDLFWWGVRTGAAADRLSRALR